jgi:hypothetical protein
VVIGADSDWIDVLAPELEKGALQEPKFLQVKERQSGSREMAALLTEAVSLG